MTNLLEDPTPIILAGIAIEAVLGIALVVTRRGVLLLAMSGAAVLCLIGVVIERVVVTDREQIAATIEAGRLAVEGNDARATLDLIDPAAVELRGDVERAFAEARFTEIKVRALKIRVTPEAQPPEGQADFTAVAAFDTRRGTMPYRNIVVTVSVALKRRGDRWLVTEVNDVQAGLGKETAPSSSFGRMKGL